MKRCLFISISLGFLVVLGSYVSVGTVPGRDGQEPRNWPSCLIDRGRFCSSIVSTAAEAAATAVETQTGQRRNRNRMESSSLADSKLRNDWQSVINCVWSASTPVATLSTLAHYETIERSVGPSVRLSVRLPVHPSVRESSRESDSRKINQHLNEKDLTTGQWPTVSDSVNSNSNSNSD